jgi:hypothetical protein
MLVEAQVSSMKIRRSGSRSSCPSNQSSRCFRTSDRFCSEACAVFFARDRVAREEALDRAEAEDQALRGEIAANLLDGGVPIGAERRQHGGVVSFDASRATVAAQRLRTGVALFALAGSPTADAGGADAEPLPSFPVRRACMNRCKNTNPEINRQSP